MELLRFRTVLCVTGVSILAWLESIREGDRYVCDSNVLVPVSPPPSTVDLPTRDSRRPGRLEEEQINTLEHVNSSLCCSVTELHIALWSSSNLTITAVYEILKMGLIDVTASTGASVESYACMNKFDVNICKTLTFIVQIKQQNCLEVTDRPSFTDLPNRGLAIAC